MQQLTEKPMTDNDLYDTVTLTSETDRRKLKGFIDEAVRHKETIKAKNEDIKMIREDAKESLGVKPKIFNRLVKAIMTDTAQEEAQDFDEFETIYETLYAPKHSSTVYEDDEEE